MLAGAFQTKAIRTCVIYLRVSSREQIDGYSLDAQERAARAYAEQRGWTVIEVYTDPGKSGKSAETRPGFRRMIADAEAHRFDAIIVHKLDRFSRSIVDILIYLERLRKSDVSFASVTESFADFTTPMGWLMLVFLAMLAEWYLKNLAFEIQKGKRERVAQGDWNGRLSFGYTTPKRLRARILQLGDDLRAGRIDEHKYSDQITKIEIVLRKYQHVDENAAIPCPFDGPGVVFAFRQYATGSYSLREVARMLSSAGWRVTSAGKRSLFTEAVVRDMLSNRFYLGEVRLNPAGTGGRSTRSNPWQVGNHAPLVDEDLFRQCALVARSRRMNTANHAKNTALRVYPFAGLLRCACCNGRWYGWTKRGTYRYRLDKVSSSRIGDCVSRVRSARADILESQFERILDHITLSPAIMRELNQRLLSSQSQVDSVSRECERLHAQAERLKRLYVAGDMSEADYERERGLIEASMSQLSEDRTEHAQELARMMVVMANLNDVWRLATLDERQLLARQLFQVMYVQDGKIIAAQPTPIAWELIEAAVRDAGRIGSYSNLWLP